MIPQVLQQVTEATVSLRSLCRDIPYATLMRWRSRAKRGEPLIQKAGPKKPEPMDPQSLRSRVEALVHGRCRSRGTSQLAAQLRMQVSRRQLAQVTRELRRDRLEALKRIQWLVPNICWAMDATEYGPSKTVIIPVRDLASQYRLPALISDRQDGGQVAGHLQQLFQHRQPPLFFKRDNGSIFNCQAVDALLLRFGVIPLNNPPYYPRYNGAMEKCIRDLKDKLDHRMARYAVVPPELEAEVELMNHELNHRPIRRLKDQTACEIYHDENRRWRLGLKGRKRIFRLLLQEFWQRIGTAPEVNQRTADALWRSTLEAWLRRQGLIIVRDNRNQKVSTNFPKNWSHN
jgi:transposase InsO family protein